MDAWIFVSPVCPYHYVKVVAEVILAGFRQIRSSTLLLQMLRLVEVEVVVAAVFAVVSLLALPQPSYVSLVAGASSLDCLDAPGPFGFG